MLNNWSPTPLLLAGLWSPPTPIVHEAVVQGVDAALCFTDEDETLQPVKQVARSITPNPLPSPKVDADLAFRLILESERNGRISSGILLPPLESSQPVTIPPSPCNETLLSQSLPVKSSVEADSDKVLVTRLRLKNSRPPSPVVLEKSKIEIEPQSTAQDDRPQPLGEEEEPATVVSHFEEVPTVSDDQMSSSCTFEDLLVDYSNLNMLVGGQTTSMKSPDHPQLSKGISAESADPEFEVVSGIKKH